MTAVAVESGAAVCAMHMQGTPQTMQDDPTYDDVVREISQYLGRRREALLAAGDHYLRSQGKTTGIPEAARIQAAVLSLGLDELAPFNPAEKIVEYRYFGVPEGLRTLSLGDFFAELSTDSPAPGGGSVAALCGALAGSLTAMVSWAKASSLLPGFGRSPRRSVTLLSAN